MACECEEGIAESLTGVVLVADGMVRGGDNGTIGVSPAVLGSIPGLCGLALAFHQPQEIDAVMARGLAEHLLGLTRLTGLNFGLSTFACGTARLLLPRLASLTALQLLDLMDVCMGPEGAVALAAALPSLGALTWLRLQGNAIGERGGAAVMAALAPAAAAGMLELRLAWTDIGVRGITALAGRRAELTSLRELDLCGNSIAGGLARLHGGLEAQAARLPALTKLDLAENSLVRSDAVALAHMLPRLPKLGTLTLRWNKIGPVGAQALAKPAVDMQHLSTVDLQYNCIGDAGAEALAGALLQHAPRDEAPTSCRSYSLSGCGIGDAGALAVADAVYRVCADRHAVMGCGACRNQIFFLVFMDENEISADMVSSLHDRSARWRDDGMGIEFCVAE